MGCGPNGLQGHGQGDAVRKPLSKAELEDLHSVLRRAAERAERNGMIRHAERLAKEVAELAEELARGVG